VLANIISEKIHLEFIGGHKLLRSGSCLASVGRNGVKGKKRIVKSFKHLLAANLAIGEYGELSRAQIGNFRLERSSEGGLDSR
jgi:hypothetical protein